MKVLLARMVVLALAFVVVDALMDTVTVSGGVLGTLGLAVLYGVLSAVIGTILRLLTLPLVILTVGLFQFVINAVLLLLAEWLTDWLDIDGIISALGASVVLTLTSVGFGLLVAVLVPDTRRS